MLWPICLFNYADRQAIFSVFPLLKNEMGLTPIELGVVGWAFTWVYGLMAPSPAHRRRSRHPQAAILGGLHLSSIICDATALSTNSGTSSVPPAEGLGETFYFPASMSLIADYHGRDTRSRAMGLHQTSVYVGTIGGGFLAGYSGQHYGWRLSFISLAASASCWESRSSGSSSSRAADRRSSPTLAPAMGRRWCRSG